MKDPGKCKWCGVQLTHGSAYASKNSPTGLQGKCKDCDKLWGRKRNASDFRSGHEDHSGAGVGRKLPRRRICRLCCGLPHRVEGEKCVACGLPWGANSMEAT